MRDPVGLCCESCVTQPRLCSGSRKLGQRLLCLRHDSVGHCCASLPSAPMFLKWGLARWPTQAPCGHRGRAAWAPPHSIDVYALWQCPFCLQNQPHFWGRGLVLRVRPPPEPRNGAWVGQRGRPRLGNGPVRTVPKRIEPNAPHDESGAGVWMGAGGAGPCEQGPWGDWRGTGRTARERRRGGGLDGSH